MAKEQLNNCPNCGGTLDDTGRCVYCKTKVYDLTDIDLDGNDIHKVLRMRVKMGEEYHTFDCYLSNLKANLYASSMDTCRAIDGSICVVRRMPDMEFSLDLRVLRRVGDDE